MKKTFIIIIIIIMAISAVFFLASLLVAGMAENAAEIPDCDEIKTECCLEKKPESKPEDLIWQNFSREFISLMPRLH